MAALICLSPTLADHSFPRYHEQAKTIAVALGELSRLTLEGTVSIVTTPIFTDLLEAYDWNQPQGLKTEIYAHLNQLVFSGRTVAVDTSLIDNGSRHPIPEGCPLTEGFAELWAEDVGKLLIAHDNCTTSNAYFIGVACEQAFSGRSLNSYQRHESRRYFPLVSPSMCNCEDEACCLIDSWVFEVPASYNSAEVTFEEALRNLPVIGSTGIRPPSGGSHYVAKFPGSRSWVLDKNYPTVPPQYLRELKSLTGYPLNVIAFALKEGHLPTAHCLLKEYLAN